MGTARRTGEQVSIEVQGGAGGGATRSAEAPEVRKPSPTALVLRPVGYLLMTVLWIAIAVFPFVLGYGLIPSADLMSHLYAAWEPVEAQHLYWWEDLLGMDPERRASTIPMMVLMVGPVLGLGFLGMIAFALYPMILLYGLAFLRSLNPRYRGDRLTYTTYAEKGSTFGPVTLTGVSLSAIPTYETRFTRWVMRFYWYGWQPSGRMILGMMPAGMGLLLGVLAVDLFTPAPLRVASAVGAVALAAVSVVVVRRDWRRRYFPTPEEVAATEVRDEVTGRPVEEMTPQERLERVKALRAERTGKGSR
jgi:hypothetical protein